MKLTNKKTGESKQLRRAIASRKYNACNECALRCVEECENWADDIDKPAPAICAGLGIILVEESEDISQTHCEYCNSVKAIVSDQKYEETVVFINDDELCLEYGDSLHCEKINYCPMCGRKLNNEL